jgi:O-antigen ligase
MSASDHLLARSGRPVRRTPWLVFVFLAVVFLFVYHDWSYAKSGIGNYDAAEETIVSAVAEGSVPRRMALISLAIFAMFTLTRHRADVQLRIQGYLGWILVASAAWTFLSPIWAEDKALTVTRVTVFGILCMAALAMVSRFSLREIVLWTFFSSGLYLVIGVFAEILFGTFRPLASGYRFAGTLHPNLQGINCALFLLSGIAAADMEKSGQVIFRICALVGFFFLVLSASRTSFAVVLLALAAYAWVMYSRRAKMAMAYALSIVFCVLALVFGNSFLPNLKSAVMLGRDDSTIGSFNGRTGIWDEIGKYVQKRPIAGYGYAGFWTPNHISEISEEEKWGIPNSHSAYLDNLLALGVVGLVAYGVSLFAGIKQAFRFQRRYHNSVYAFCGALLLFCAMDSFLESAPIEPSLLMLAGMVVLAQMAFVRPDPPCRERGA